MKISKKKHLEMILENVPGHPNPKVDLEQYSTPATIAATTTPIIAPAPPEDF